MNADENNKVSIMNNLDILAELQEIQENFGSSHWTNEEVAAMVLREQELYDELTRNASKDAKS